jgi:putative ATP-dependent endonuclease of OLD family
MQYLRRTSSASQVFLTTHSTNFLDTTAMSNVYLISKTSSTGIQVLDAETAEDRLPEELGLRLSSLFLYDRLVFVEGRTDAGIIQEWASTLGINFNQANVGFVQIGGARNFAYYAAERTLSFLAKRKVKTWFLLDRDEAEIQKLVKGYANTTQVRFLERREIENYLLSPQALVRFIQYKLSLDGSKAQRPDEATVQAAIIKCANDLKETSLSKRAAKRACVPVYPALRNLTESQQELSVPERIRGEIDRMIAELTKTRQAVDGIVAEQTALLNEQWQKAYASIVPGDLLLDAVCKEFGVRFKKDRDGDV